MPPIHEDLLLLEPLLLVGRVRHHLKCAGECGRTAMRKVAKMMGGGAHNRASEVACAHRVLSGRPANGADFAVLVGELERLDQAQGLVHGASHYDSHTEKERESGIGGFFA